MHYPESGPRGTGRLHAITCMTEITVESHSITIRLEVLRWMND